jgi:hypothetical protein
MANNRKTLAIGAAFSELWRSLVNDLFGSYRPERHYMRGPGPKWRAKRGYADGTTRTAAALPLRQRDALPI